MREIGVNCFTIVPCSKFESAVFACITKIGTRTTFAHGQAQRNNRHELLQNQGEDFIRESIELLYKFNE